MRKLSFLFVGILSMVMLLSSCAKDDNYIDGDISYVAHSNGKEYVADGATVYLMTAGSSTEYEQKTTADSDGHYKFYPVNDGDYYIEADYTYLLDDYAGKSDAFNTKGKDNLTFNLTLK